MTQHRSSRQLSPKGRTSHWAPDTITAAPTRARDGLGLTSRWFQGNNHVPVAILGQLGFADVGERVVMILMCSQSGKRA